MATRPTLPLATRPTLDPATATFGLSSAELLATMAFLVVFRLLNRDFFWIVIVLAPRKPAFCFRCGFDAFLFSKGHAKLGQTITKPYSPLESIGCRKADLIRNGSESSEFSERLKINRVWVKV
jgi:hypothetical protein